MFGLVVVLVYNSWAAISALGLELPDVRRLVADRRQYGALAALAGTVMTTAIAMVIAVPLALVIALLLVELVHPARGARHRHGIEMLAAIPSIIFGMWGLFVLVPFMQDTSSRWSCDAAWRASRLCSPGRCSRAAASRSSRPGSFSR